MSATTHSRTGITGARVWGGGTILFVILVVGLIALVYINYQCDIQRERDRVLAGSQIVDTPCGPSEYAAAGSGQPVLVAHGAGGGFDQGLDLAGPLVENGFRVIAVSRFGYLRTPLPTDASSASQADAYACLLDTLSVPRAAVIGVSAGAPSAMQFALRHRERIRALVLLNPATYPAQLDARADGALPKQSSPAIKLLFDTALKSDLLLWAAFRLAPKIMFPVMVGTPAEVVAGASDDERARAEQVMDHLLPFSQRRLGVLNDALITPFLPRYDLERIDVPTLILGTADDLYGTFEGAKYSAEHIPHARFIAYRSGGHIMVGHREDALNKIESFLGSIHSEQ